MLNRTNRFTWKRVEIVVVKKPITGEVIGSGTKESILLLLKKNWRVETVEQYNEEQEMKLFEKISRVKEALKPRALTEEELELCKRLGKDGYTALEEVFQSLSDVLRSAVLDSFGPDCYIADFSQDEVIFSKIQNAPSTKGVEMYQKVGYKIENGAVLFVGTPQETQRISRWE
jgi:hypothetical protein